jgi:hypothetical protein
MSSSSSPSSHRPARPLDVEAGSAISSSIGTGLRVLKGLVEPLRDIFMPPGDCRR